MLERYEGKLSRTVLRREEASNRLFLVGTVHGILKIVECDWPYLRDKSSVACLFESCCRPHEFFMLKRRDIEFEIVPAEIWNGKGGQIKVDIEIATLQVSNEAKTGGRLIPLVFTFPLLKAWLRQSGNTEYIWMKLRGANAKQPIEYPEARKALKKIAECAGIPPEKCTSTPRDTAWQQKQVSI
jgi:integrase